MTELLGRTARERDTALALAEEMAEALRPFADKATKYEANHPERMPRRWLAPYPPDSSQITHRLGDFREARAILAKFDAAKETDGG